MKVVLGGKSTANAIGNPVDDKSEGVIMFFGGGRCSSSRDGCFLKLLLRITTEENI